MFKVYRTDILPRRSEICTLSVLILQCTKIDLALTGLLRMMLVISLERR